MKLFDLLDRRAVKDDAIADDTPDPRPVHGRETWRIVPHLDEESAPLGSGSAGKTNWNAVERASGRAIIPGRADLIRHDLD